VTVSSPSVGARTGGIDPFHLVVAASSTPDSVCQTLSRSVWGWSLSPSVRVHERSALQPRPVAVDGVAAGDRPQDVGGVV